LPEIFDEQGDALGLGKLEALLRGAAGAALSTR
jgi:hypothetical protein